MEKRKISQRIDILFCESKGLLKKIPERELDRKDLLDTLD
jgi:hypothetical protein